jgi:dolichyl-phosphate-mannose--protein O-mannosyl transferase
MGLTRIDEHIMTEKRFHGHDSNLGFAQSLNKNTIQNEGGSSITNQQQGQHASTDTDGCVRFGSNIVLKHNTTGLLLSSHPVDYGAGSKQQEVFAGSLSSDENHHWVVLPAFGERRKVDDIVSYNTPVRLRHRLTRRNLHSHSDVASPKTYQQEVTCFGDDNVSDINDNWLVQRHSYTNNYDNSGYWMINDIITLRHIQTGATLHSHRIPLHDDLQEVTCFGPGHEDNDKWSVQII